jgi:hypothetical protein
MGTLEEMKAMKSFIVANNFSPKSEASFRWPKPKPKPPLPKWWRAEPTARRSLRGKPTTNSRKGSRLG